jgi:hypothetical protein
MTEFNTPNNSDKTSDIEKMIASENDPRQRAFLIVLNSINFSLIANTRTITNVSDKLDRHLTNFEEHASSEAELINKGRGAWRIAAWILGAAQLVAMGAWGLASNKLTSIDTSIRDNMVVDARHTTELDNIKSRIAKIEGRAK